METWQAVATRGGWRALAARPGDPLPTGVYRIDDHDVITWANDECSVCAENGGAADLGGRAAGRPIWNFLDGDVVPRVYRVLLERVRARDLLASIPLCCDAPAQPQVGTCRSSRCLTGGSRFRVG